MSAVQLDRRQAGIALAFVAALISGISVYVNAIAVRAFGDPTLYTTLKNLIAGALLVVATGVLLRGGRARIERPRGRRQLVGLAAIGVFGGGVAFILFFQGLAHTSASSAGFVQKTLIIWVAVLAVAFLRERFSLVHAAAIALLVTGQLVVSGGAGLSALGAGDLMVFVATLIWAAEVVLAKRLLGTLSPMTVALARMGVGSVVLVAFSISSGAATALPALTAGQWGWVAVTGVILSLYVAVWFSALARATAIDVTAVLVFSAVVTAAISSAAGSSASLSGAGLALIAIGAAGIAVTALRRSPARLPA